MKYELDTTEGREGAAEMFETLAKRLRADEFSPTFGEIRHEERMVDNGEALLIAVTALLVPKDPTPSGDQVEPGAAGMPVENEAP